MQQRANDTHTTFEAVLKEVFKEVLKEVSIDTVVVTRIAGEGEHFS